MSIAYLDGKGPVKEFELTEDGMVGCWNCGSMRVVLIFSVDPKYNFLTRAQVECVKCGHRGRYEHSSLHDYSGLIWSMARARAKANWNFECTRMSRFWNLRSPCHYNWGY